MKLVSPKGDRENKLIDSLDNTSYLTSQNKILFADKKGNWKLKRAGSDDKPKNMESKRTSNLKGSTSGISLITNINNQTRDKDRKFSLKASNDKQVKTRDSSLINMSNNLSSKIKSSFHMFIN